MQINHKKISLPLLDLEGIVFANIKSQSDGYCLIAVNRLYVDLANEGGLGRNRFGPTSHPSCYLPKITPDARL